MCIICDIGVDNFIIPNGTKVLRIPGCDNNTTTT